jgi:hypothetical protein
MHLLASHERTGSGSHRSNPTLLHMHWLLQRQRSLPCQWLNRGQQRANNHICDITILCSAEIAALSVASFGGVCEVSRGAGDCRARALCRLAVVLLGVVGWWVVWWRGLGF